MKTGRKEEEEANECGGADCTLCHCDQTDFGLGEEKKDEGAGGGSTIE